MVWDRPCWNCSMYTRKIITSSQMVIISVFFICSSWETTRRIQSRFRELSPFGSYIDTEPLWWMKLTDLLVYKCLCQQISLFMQKKNVFGWICIFIPFEMRSSIMLMKNINAKTRRKNTFKFQWIFQRVAKKIVFNLSITI